MPTEHILIMRFSAMGDVAMTVPVIASLANTYPHLRITVLSRPYARSFFENIASNVGFMEADFKKEYKGIKGLNKLYRRLAAKNFTAVADMHDILRTKYLCLNFRLTKHKVAVINKHRKGKKQLTRKNNKILQQQPTSFENYAEVLKKLGYPIDIQFNSLFNNEKGNLSLLPPIIGEKKEKWIGIAPFATHQGKIYPLDKMKETVELLLKELPNARIFLFGGGKNEFEILNKWTTNDNKCINASQSLGSLQQELILMSNLDVMLSMDSANMHLASLVGTKVVSIWGATHPLAGFMGWNQSIDNSIQIDLPCRPCSVYGNKKCLRDDYACLNIKPKTIVEKIKTVIK